MPMYEYKCTSCGHAFERYSAGKDGQEDGGSCPVCKKGRAKKVFSTFASTCCGGGGLSAPASGGCGGGSSHFS
jgi:putative FmdB family regulatory protein